MVPSAETFGGLALVTLSFLGRKILALVEARSVFFLLINHMLLFFAPLSERLLDKFEISLTGSLNLNSNKAFHIPMP